MRIGNYEAPYEESQKINELITGFLGIRGVVIEGFPPKTGRSADGKQFCLNVNNERFVSVKLAYDSPQNISWELFHAEMRPLLNLPHYSLVRKNGFPLPNWNDKDYIIMDWGPKDRRFHMGDDRVKTSLEQNADSLLRGIAKVASQNYLFATSDRKKEHFIWDLDDKVLFSIDHEIPTQDSNEVSKYFRNELKSIFGDTWFDDADKKKCFEDAFLEIWNNAVGSRETILRSYNNNNLDSFSPKFMERITIGSQSVLQRIMS